MAARRQRPLLESGTRVPDFRLERLEGGETTLGELLARSPLVLAFYKVSCPVCQMTFPYLEKLAAAGHNVVGISQNDPEETREFNQEFGITFSVLLDTEDAGYPVSNMFGISSVPTIFLIDQNRTISGVIEGWVKREIVQLAEQTNTVLFDVGDRVPEMKPG